MPAARDSTPFVEDFTVLLILFSVSFFCILLAYRLFNALTQI